jgi:hypothetical protein
MDYRGLIYFIPKNIGLHFKNMQLCKVTYVETILNGKNLMQGEEERTMPLLEVVHR